MVTKKSTLVATGKAIKQFKELDLSTYQDTQNSCFELIKKDPILH
jgi:hypothetical protein